MRQWKTAVPVPQMVVLMVVLMISGWARVSVAQKSSTAQTPQKQESKPAGNAGAEVVGDAGEEPDEPAAPAPVASKTTAAGNSGTAWKLLEDGLASGKPQIRIDAVSALGTLGATGKSRSMMEKALKDKERDVRLSAVIALGSSKSRSVIPLLQDALDNDGAPEVGYAAATALWKMHDHSGEDVLFGVLSGQLKTHQGLVGSEMHTASRDLHDPAVLARIGAEQGAYALLGPFGIGLDAAKMIYKGPNANSARVLTATLLSEDKSTATAREFISVLHDKDYFVRAASARALGEYHGKEVRDALLELFDDRKPTVRFMAAASYIRVNNGEVRSPKTDHRASPGAHPGE